MLMRIYSDGTCVRDYLHVLDLAKGHLLALDALAPESKVFDDCPTEARYKAYNLGRGKGMSVLQIVEAMRAQTKFDFKYEIVDRRCVWLLCVLGLSSVERHILQAWRRPRPHGGPCARGGAAGLQGGQGPRDDVPRPLELADEEPPGV